MKAAWTRLVARINGFSPRERFLLFACIVVILGAITEEVFIAPLTHLQTQYARDLEKRSASMEAVRERLEKTAMLSRRAELAAVEADLARVQSQIGDIGREIASLGASSSDVAAWRGVLTRTLRQSDKVTLIRVATTQPTAAPVAGAAQAEASGVEVTLAGGYLDLMDYFGALQAALPYARWSGLRLNAETVPPQATVRILATRGTP